MKGRLMVHLSEGREQVKSIAVVGTGLMGASLGLSAKRAFPQARIWGVDSSAQALEEARAMGAVDEAVPLQEAVKADLLCLAMPMRYLPEVLQQLGPALREGVLWMDIGSSKQNVLSQVKASLGELPPHFVPCHPMAGGEEAGAKAARADLYSGRKVLLIPHEGMAAGAKEKATAFWQALGAEVVEMGAKEHDEILAYTSHLPHLLAFALAGALDVGPGSQRLQAGMGPGFFGFMRLAKSEPSLWADICMANREALLTAMKRYEAQLRCMQAALEEASGPALLALLEEAHQRRQAW